MHHNRFYNFLMTSYLVPIALGLFVLDPILKYISHPEIYQWLVPIGFWVVIFGGVMLLRHQHQKKMSDQILSVFGPNSDSASDQNTTPSKS